MADDSGKKKRSPIWLLIKLAIAAVAVAIGWKFGVGPLLSAQKGESSVVYVINSTDTAYDASFGWRRIQRVLHPDSLVKFELFVGGKEKQTLTLTPQGGGTPRKMEIELWPKCQLMINLNRAEPLYAYHPDAISQESIKFRGMANEMKNQSVMFSEAMLSSDIYNLTKKACVGKVDQEIIDLTQYRPWILEIDEFAEKPAPGPLPLLTAETLTFTLTNGTFTWNASKPADIKLETKLPEAVSAPLATNVTGTLPAGAPMHFEWRKDYSSLRINSTVSSKCVWDSFGWVGGWSYEGHLVTMDKGPNGRDTVNMLGTWMFSGSAKIKGDEWSFGASFPPKGPPKITKEKMEMMP